ncbi:MAG TPA: hypothetical protein VLR92_12430 [Blastocatellia bacterium]|nr:hypothetical protein [Blastocatellia bacterium]
MTFATKPALRCSTARSGLLAAPRHRLSTGVKSKQRVTDHGGLHPRMYRRADHLKRFTQSFKKLARED